MPLNTRYIIASDLQSYFVDKETGEPLAGGVIRFYKDQARTEPKDVFQLSGNPPNYGYTNLGAEITLSAVGTVMNNVNQDIILYYYPYDEDGHLELYYVTVESELGEEQFTREAWPNSGVATTQEQDFQNFAPNGQFLLHNDIPATEANTYIAGQVSEPITVIAPGGWTFERPADSTATDVVTFVPFGSAVADPASNPRFFIKIQCQSPDAGDAYKDIRLKFTDVNKFASDTQKYTLAFSGQSNGSGSASASLILIKNYGTGGDPTEEIPLANVTIATGAFKVIQTVAGFVFGDNIGKNIGLDGDDYLQLALRLPLSSVFDVSITDFILTVNVVAITDFPQAPDSEFSYQSLTIPTPPYDGSDLYLPIRRTPNGLFADASEVGEVVYESNVSLYVNSLHPYSNKMLGDGNQYETAGYSPIGIPFARLQAEYWLSTLNLPIYGTGADYLMAIVNASLTNQLIVANNSNGLVTYAADGTPATGFAFAPTHAGASYACESYLVPTNGFYIQNTSAGVVTAPTVGTSGYSITVVQKGDSVLPEIISVGPGASTNEGTYFTFSVWTGGGSFSYYVWFQLDGVGVDPAVPSHAGILVNLTGGDTPAVVSQKISLALNGGNQVQTIDTVAGSAIPEGAYFSLSSTGDDFYVWYQVDGSGTDPKPVDKKPIPVKVASTDTSAQVATKTQIAINQKYFASPKYQGYFLRAFDPDSLVDLDNPARYSFIPGIIGAMLGTIERDTNKNHAHIYDYTETDPNATLEAGATSGVTANPIETTYVGSYESRPINKNVNVAIRY